MSSLWHSTDQQGTIFYVAIQTFYNNYCADRFTPERAAPFWRFYPTEKKQNLVNHSRLANSLPRESLKWKKNSGNLDNNWNCVIKIKTEKQFILQSVEFYLLHSSISYSQHAQKQHDKKEDQVEPVRGLENSLGRDISDHHCPAPKVHDNN